MLINTILFVAFIKKLALLIENEEIAIEIELTM